MLAMLDHPNIISYYDSFEEDGLVMIEMEYADGGYVLAEMELSYIVSNCLSLLTDALDRVLSFIR